jgi:hypothetical protein
VTDVKLLARWDGWCDPCETERPLVLTETGQRGVRAWLRGIGHEDRELTLTCGVCGEWQAVTHDEQDLPEVGAPLAPIAAVTPLGVSSIVVRTAVLTPARLTSMPAGRTVDLPDATLELLAEGLDLITLAS